MFGKLKYRSTMTSMLSTVSSMVNKRYTPYGKSVSSPEP